MEPELEITLLDEINQDQKNKHHVFFSLMCKTEHKRRRETALDSSLLL